MKLVRFDSLVIPKESVNKIYMKVVEKRNIPFFQKKGRYYHAVIDYNDCTASLSFSSQKEAEDKVSEWAEIWDDKEENPEDKLVYGTRTPINQQAEKPASNKT